jgi:hypothetical protein
LKQSKPFYVALLLWLNLNNPRLELLLLQERIVAYPLRYLSSSEKVLSANCQRTFSELLSPFITHETPLSGEMAVAVSLGKSEDGESYF